MGRSEPHPSWATPHPFSSDANHPELVVTPRLLAQSHKPASTQTPAANGAPRSLPSARLTADLRVSTPISQVHWFTGMRRQNSGKHLTCIYWVVKEATQEEPTGREAWGGVWMAGGGGFYFLSGTPPSRHLPCSKTRNLQNPIFQVFLWRPHYRGVADWIMCRW